MYRGIWCLWRRDGKRHRDGKHSHRHAAGRKHGSITQCCFNVRPASKTVGLKHNSYWVNVMCLRKVYSGHSDGLVLDQRRRRLTNIDPAMGFDAGPTLNRNLMGRPTSSVHRRKALNECWPSPAMVEAGIHVEDIF